MLRKHTFSVRFVLIKSKVNKRGEAPIYARLNFNGKELDISIRRFIEPERWDSAKGELRGSKEDARTINKALIKVKAELEQISDDLERESNIVTAESIKRKYQGLDKSTHTLADIITKHNNEMSQLLNIDFSEGTLKRYKTIKKHIDDFLKKQYNCNDLRLDQVDYAFISSFEHYLKTNKIGHNTTVKYIRCLRKIINYALKLEWIEKDPFLRYSNKLEEVEREFLTQDELDAIVKKEISIPRLDLVRDIFVFSCYTGLAFADVEKLTNNNLVKASDGETWIKINRTKTGTKSSILLLPVPLVILKKYKDNSESQYAGRLLPVKSNQKMNAYLKEIADICGINKNITFHLARHTFATTVTLTNNVPIESVSAMLGHKNMRTTQIYAKVLDQKVNYDMKALKEKLNQ